MTHRIASPLHAYTLAPLDTPGTSCVRVAAKKIAQGVLQACDSGVRLRLEKAGLPTLTVSGVPLGRVKVGIDEATGLAYAVKKYRLNDSRLARSRHESQRQTAAYLIDRLADEGTLGTTVRSPLAISTLWITNKHVYGQMPLMFGDLSGIKRGGVWTKAQAVKALYAVLVDLERLHARGFAHCDIKPANIMHRDSPDTAMLGDFTLVRRLGDRRAACGTPYHMAPEQQLAKHQRVTVANWAAADVWGVGSSFLDLLVGNPFECSSAERNARLQAYARWHHLIRRDTTLSRWRAGRVPHAARFITTFGALDVPLREVFFAMMHPDPASRPTAAQARRMVSGFWHAV